MLEKIQTFSSQDQYFTRSRLSRQRFRQGMRELFRIHYHVRVSHDSQSVSSFVNNNTKIILCTFFILLQ